MAIQSEKKQFPVKSYFLQNLNVPLIGMSKGLALTVVWNTKNNSELLREKKKLL